MFRVHSGKENRTSSESHETPLSGYFLSCTTSSFVSIRTERAVRLSFGTTSRKESFRRKEACRLPCQPEEIERRSSPGPVLLMKTLPGIHPMRLPPHNLTAQL